MLYGTNTTAELKDYCRVYRAVKAIANRPARLSTNDIGKLLILGGIFFLLVSNFFFLESFKLYFVNNLFDVFFPCPAARVGKDTTREK